MDEVFVIPGINKVKVSVISQAKGQEWWYLPRPRLFGISLKPNLIIVLLYIVFKKIMTNTPSQGTWIDIVIGNHALNSQPTAY